MPKNLKPVRKPIPSELYEKFIAYFPYVCVDVFVRNPKTNELLLLKRAGNPVKGEFWPIGGRLLLFERPEEAAVRKVFDETGLVVDSDTVRLIGIGNTLFIYGEYRHTINLTFVADLDMHQGGWDKLDLGKGEFTEFVLIKDERDLAGLTVNRDKANINQLHYLRSRTVHPYIRNMLLESKILNQTEPIRPTRTILSSEATGILSPFAARKGKNRRKRNASALDQAALTYLFPKFQRYMPVIYIESMVAVEGKGVLLKITDEGLKPARARLTLGESIDIAAFRILREEFGDKDDKRHHVGRLGYPNSRHGQGGLIAIDDRRIRVGRLGQEIVFIYTQSMTHNKMGNSKHYVWIKTRSELEELHNIDAHLKELILKSGIFDGSLKGPSNTTFYNEAH